MDTLIAEKGSDSPYVVLCLCGLALGWLRSRFTYEAR